MIENKELNKFYKNINIPVDIKTAINESNSDKMNELIQKANRIKKIL